MDGKMKEFLELYNNKSNRVVYNILKKISDLGYEDDFLQTYKSVEDVERIILDLQPTSIRAITTICYAFGLYAKFVGGIMHRICSELENNNVSIERAFAYNNKDEMVNGIINKELSRCEYDISSSAFREQVSGYLEVFA